MHAAGKQGETTHVSDTDWIQKVILALEALKVRKSDGLHTTFDDLEKKCDQGPPRFHAWQDVCSRRDASSQERPTAHKAAGREYVYK
jgi:hypothetical protein